MRTTLIGRWSEKNSKTFVALLAAGATLAIAMLVDASSSHQVEQLGQMAIHRSAHKATALSDGRVLITGGRNAAGIVIADAEIFDPSTGESSAVAPMGTARVDHTATLLKDGRVLITGGSNATGTLNSAEIFDPSTGTFSAVSGRLNMARARHTATLLSSGKVLIAGGDVTPTLVDPNGTDVTGTAEIFDPTARTFGDLVLLQRSRSDHTATLFSNDTVWLVGGGNNTIESFSASTEAFTLSDTTMTAMRSGHDAIALSDTRLLFLGGDPDHTIDEFNPVLSPNVAGVYSPDATDQVTAFSAFDETSVPDSTTLKRSGQTATELLGDKTILIAGGENAQHQPSLQIATFNPARIWTDKDDYLPGDNVVLSGSGWKPNENVYLYAVDDTTEAWTYGSTVAADSSGGFVVNPYFVVQLVQLGANFSVSAVGAQSAMQADVKFTDAGNFQYSPGSQSLTIAAGSSSSSFSQSITDPKNNDALTAAPVVAGTGAGGTSPLPVFWVSVTTSPTSTPPKLSFPASSSDQTQSWSVKITVPSATTAGTYTGNIKATATANPGGTKTPGDGQGTDLTIIVPAQPTSLVVSSASGTYGGTSTSLSATLTSGGNPVSGKTVSFTLNGNSVGNAPTDASGVATVSGVSLCGSSYNVGSYPSGVAASFAADGTYAAANGTASLTVGKANAMVVVTPYSVTYDGTSHTATVTSITGVCGETGATVGTVNVTNTSHTDAGTYNADTWSFTGTANYNNIAATTITDTINKATPAFSSLTASQTIAQGTATISLSGRLNAGAGSTQVSPVGQMATITINGVNTTSTGFTGNAGNFSATVNTSAIPGGTYTITYSYGGDLTNFNPATPDTSTKLTVTSSATSLAVNPANGTYGETVNLSATLTLTSGGSGVGGKTIAFTLNGNSVGTATTNGSGVATLNGASLSGINANTYPTGVGASFAGDSANLASNGTASLTVGKATPTATLAATNSPQTYNGSGQAALVSISTSSVPGTVANILTGGAATKTNAGTYAVTANFVPNDTTNYETLTGLSAGNFIIDKADASFTVTPYDVTYDGFEHKAAVSTITGVNSETGATVGTVNVSNTAHTNADTYSTDSWSFTGTSNYNDITATTITDSIKKAHLTVTAEDQSKTYDGHAFTAFTAILSGFVNSETDNALRGTGALSGAAGFTGAATTAINAGAHTITPTANTLTATNYDFPAANFVNGTLTINKAHLTVTADNQSKTYDGHTFSAFTAILTGFVNSETDTGLRGAGALSGAAGFTGAATTAINAGTHTITPTVNTLSATNYDFPAANFVNGILTIYKAHLTVTADNQSKTYNGAVFSPFTATLSGFVNSETDSGLRGSGALSGAAAFGGAASTAVNAGTYIITPSVGSLSATNYDFPGANFVNGTLTIYKVHLTVTADNQSKTYDGAVFTGFTVTFSGFVNNENNSVVSGAAAFTGNAVTAINAGIYTITPTVNTLTATNYDFPAGNFVNATLTIDKAHLTVKATDKTKVYDNTPYSPFTATLSEFVNNETDSGLRGTGALSGAAAFTGAFTSAYLPGTYTITPSVGTLSATNYDFTPFNNGTLTITYGTCSGSTPSGVILQPINSDGTSVYQRKGGSTIPVKFTLCDASGNPISNAAAVFAPTGGAITPLSAVRGTVNNINEVLSGLPVTSGSLIWRPAI